MMQLWLSSSDMRTVSEVTSGVIVDTIAWYKALSQSDDHDSAEEEECSESDAQESSLREMLVQQGQQLRALQKDIQILKVCLRNL